MGPGTGCSVWKWRAGTMQMDEIARATATIQRERESLRREGPWGMRW
jgi:hypothetical protein